MLPCIYVYFSFQLIRINDPDLILFVGEALVGNEAVDQLSKFNQALADFSSQENPRLIDGILLTKFDTIDDKVWCILVNFYFNETTLQKTLTKNPSDSAGPRDFSTLLNCGLL